MHRFLLALALLVLPASPVAAQEQALNAQVMEVDSSDYPNITLYVRVTDSAGRPVAGLSPGDFTVTEDGQPVAISDFGGAGSSPINTVLVIDRSASMAEAGKIAGARTAALAYIEQMRDADRTAVIAFDERPVVLTGFTSDTATLADAIRRIRTGSSTALYDSLIEGVDLLATTSGRHALLLLTDGRDCLALPCDVPASAASLDQAIAHATEAGIPVQTIGLGERTGDLRGGIDEPVLRRIAEATGGEYFYAPGAAELADLYRALSSDMQQEYRLTYRSPRPFYDGTRRDIQVVVAGAAPTQAGYVEQHLINVESDPVVGLLLLLPIAIMLVLPALVRRTAAPGSPAPRATVPPPAPGASAPTTATQARCRSCDAALLDPGDRFCIACGAPQLELPQRRFCEACGRPLRQGAHFCPHCGTRVPVDHERAETT